MVYIGSAGVDNAVVVQQLDVPRLQHIVHSEVNAVSQVLHSLEGPLLQVCQLRHILVPRSRPDEAVLKVGDQVALQRNMQSLISETEQAEAAYPEAVAMQPCHVRLVNRHMQWPHGLQRSKNVPCAMFTWGLHGSYAAAGTMYVEILNFSRDTAHDMVASRLQSVAQPRRHFKHNLHTIQHQLHLVACVHAVPSSAAMFLILVAGGCAELTLCQLKMGSLNQGPCPSGISSLRSRYHSSASASTSSGCVCSKLL